MTVIFCAKNISDTDRLGRILAEVLEGGTVVSLIGTLGAGKTRLVQAVAEHLGVPLETVTSPTFVLLNEYDGEKPIYHFDTYRLESETQFRNLGPNDYFEGTGISFVEWGDKYPDSLPPDRLEIRIEIDANDARTFTINAIGNGYQHLIEKISKSL